MKICQKCGREMPDEYGFCITCGEKLEEQAKTVAASEENAGAEKPLSAEGSAGDSGTAEGAAAEAGAAGTEPDGKAGTAESAGIPAEDTEAVESAADAAPAETISEKTAGAAQTSWTLSNSGDSGLISEDTPKKGNGKKIGLIAGVVALAAVAVVGVSAAMLMKSEDPKETVIGAFKSVYEEDTVNHLDDIFGFTGMAETMKTESAYVDMALKVDSSNISGTEMAIGSGINIQSQSDVQAQKSAAVVGVQYQGMDLLHAEAYFDDTEIMVAIPELSSRVFALNYADDLQGQIERSPFLGEYIMYSGIDMDAFTEYIDYIYEVQNAEEKPFDVAALWERYKTGSEAIEELKAAMTVEKGEKSTQIVDGKEQECRDYKAVIPAEAVIEFFRTSSDFFLEDETLKKDTTEYLRQVIKLSKGMSPYSYMGMDAEEIRDEAWTEAEESIDQLLDELEEIMQDDLDMVVSVDKKGRLAALEVKTTLSSEGENVEIVFNTNLKGGDYLIQNVDMEFLMTNSDDDEVALELVKTESYDGNELDCYVDVSCTALNDSYNAKYSGSYMVDSGEYKMLLELNSDNDKVIFSLDGVVESLEKGKSMEASVDALRIEYHDQFIELTGSYGMGAFDGEITAPEGDKLDILAASETDWYIIAEEIMTKANQIAYKFNLQ